MADRQITIADVRRAQDHADSVASAYLNERGWRFRCFRPDGRWLWELDHAGRLMVMDRAAATDFQHGLDLHAELSAKVRAAE